MSANSCSTPVLISGEGAIWASRVLATDNCCNAAVHSGRVVRAVKPKARPYLEIISSILLYGIVLSLGYRESRKEATRNTTLFLNRRILTQLPFRDGFRIGVRSSRPQQYSSVRTHNMRLFTAVCVWNFFPNASLFATTP